MSTFAEWAVVSIVVATLACEVVAYYAYRNDNDPIFANLLIAIVGVLAIAVTVMVDRSARPRP